MAEARPQTTPPLNFAMVEPGIYRSGYPNPRNFSYLRGLRLKTIVYLGAEQYRTDNTKFADEEGIKVLHIPLPGNVEPLVSAPRELLHQAVAALLDQAHHPVLVHCNKGKYRTGCIVGCFRKQSCWSLVAIFEEYHRYAGSNGRLLDEQIIELYDHDM